MQLADIGQASQRRQVGGELDHHLDLSSRLLVSPELDQRVDDDAVRRAVVGERIDRGPTGLEREIELMTSELEATQSDQHQDVIRGQVASTLERGVGRCVQRRVGGLADPLEERQTEIALRRRVVWICVDPRGQRLDECLGRRRHGRLWQAAAPWWASRCPQVLRFRGTDS